MPQTFPVTAAVELAVVERSGFVESRHAGSAIVLAPDGSVLASHGDPAALILPRSALKPLQAVAVLTAGAALHGEHLGLATASHSGTDRHVAVVREILGAAGLTSDALQCPPALPTDGATRTELIRERLGADRLRHNCSGKHAAMLAACVAAGWPLEDYLAPAHPLQQHIRDIVERLTGEKIAAIAVDGCGAPVPALTLTGLARGIHRIGASSQTSPFALHRHAGTLVRTVRELPWTIAGPGQPDTVLAERLGLFAKLGAEGVQVAIAPDGTTVALKTLDGSARVGAAVAVHLLQRAGAIEADAAVDATAHLPLAVSGGGAPVGAIRPTVGTV